MIYANLISNFFDNLNEKIASLLNLDTNEFPAIKKKLSHVQELTKSFISNPTNKVKIDNAYYELFKQDLTRNFPSFLSIVLEIEKQVKFESVKDYLQKKKRELESIGNSEGDYKILLRTRVLELYIQKNTNVSLKDPI